MRKACDQSEVLALLGDTALEVTGARRIDSNRDGRTHMNGEGDIVASDGRVVACIPMTVLASHAWRGKEADVVDLIGKT